MMTAWIVPVAVIIIGMIILYAKIVACVLTVSTIILVPIAVDVITWKVAEIADCVKIAPFFVLTVEPATFVQAVKEISVITANYVMLVR